MAEIVILALPPTGKDVHAQYGAYQWCNLVGRTEEWDYHTFKLHMQNGHVILHELRDDGALAARFGIELMHDAKGPYISFIYYQGRFKVSYAIEITRHLFNLSRQYMSECGEPGPGRLFVYGRRMWFEVFKRLGITCENGWIDGNQEVFRDGNFGRQQSRADVE